MMTSIIKGCGRAVGWIGAWSLYWLGVFFGKLAYRVWGGFYSTYNWLMWRSGTVQEWAGLNSPWLEMEQTQEEVKQ